MHCKMAISAIFKIPYFYEYMTPIDIQVSRSKVKVKGQAYSLYVGEGGH